MAAQNPWPPPLNGTLKTVNTVSFYGLCILPRFKEQASSPFGRQAPGRLWAVTSGGLVVRADSWPAWASVDRLL